MSKTVLSQAIQFSISTQFSSIWPIDRTLSGSTHSGPEWTWERWKRVSHIPQSSSITGASLSDCLMSYPIHLLGESYPSAEKQTVYSTALANWAKSTPQPAFKAFLENKVIYCAISNWMIILWCQRSGGKPFLKIIHISDKTETVIKSSFVFYFSLNRSINVIMDYSRIYFWIWT